MDTCPTDKCMRHFRMLSSDAKPAEAEPARRVRHPGGFSLVEASALDRGDLSCSPSPRSSAADCVAGHIGLELANVALTQRDLHRSLLGVREKSLIRKCSVTPRSSPEITKNRHFRDRGRDAHY